MLKYCFNNYKVHEVCERVVDVCLPALKFIPDWFVTPKMVNNVYLLYSLMMILILKMVILIMLHS